MLDAGKLIEEHSAYVLAVLKRIVGNDELAQDAFQESTIKVIHNIKTLKKPEAFKTWFVTIAVNTARNMVRKNKDHLMDDVVDRVISKEKPVDKMMFESHLKDFVASLIEELPHRQQLAFSLRLYDGLRFKDIAEIMNCPYDTAKANYRHAFLKVKTQMKEHGKGFL